MKTKLTLIALITTVFLNAQTPNYNGTDNRMNATRNSFWFEGNFNGTIARYKDSTIKWQYQLDYQYRRMADANYVKDGNTMNIFRDPFQNVYRPWIHYWITPKKVRLSLSPIGYWGTWTPTGEGTQLFYGEIRVCPQVTFFQNVGRFEFQHRYRYEFRWLTTKDPAPANGSLSDYSLGTDYMKSGQKMRMRYFLRVNYSLNGKKSNEKGAWYLTAWNELFLGVGANTTDAKIMDQDRVVLMVGRYLKCKYPIKVEVGYTLQYSPKYDTNLPAGQTPGGAYSYGKLNWEANNCFQVYLIMDEFHQFLQKKKTPVAPVTPVTNP